MALNYFIAYQMLHRVARVQSGQSILVHGASGGVDAAFDPIGGGHFWRSYAVLRKGGRLVAYGQNNALRNGKRNLAIGALGFLGGIALPNLKPDGKKTGFYNAWSLEKKQPEAYREDLTEVLNLLSADKIAPREVATLPLRDATEAFRQLEQGVTGKLVLTTD